MKRVLLVALFAWGCTPPPPTGSPLVAHPAVSAPVVAQTRKQLLLATPFDCQAYAYSITPWTGSTPSRIFEAANEATLPDAPEFQERRSNACTILQEYAASQPAP